MNGERVPKADRKLLAEVFGATTERLRRDLHEGDWVVFHVVANRLRWGGSSYFGARAADPAGRLAFASTTKGNWSHCDDVDQVKRFIAERGFGADQLVVPPEVPWGGATKQWRAYIGRPLPGDGVWGKAPSTWIKCVVPPRGAYEPPFLGAEPTDDPPVVEGPSTGGPPTEGPPTGGPSTNGPSTGGSYREPREPAPPGSREPSRSRPDPEPPPAPPPVRSPETR